ncbi:MAG: SMP-30/gluconolactonase/LRE family protein [Pseudomonadota bacterium]
MRAARLAAVVLALAGAGALALVLTPGPVDAVAWTPPPDPGLSGAMAPNEHLVVAELVRAEAIYGPEDVAVGRDGALYAGMQDGRIVRLAPSGAATTLAQTGGRPLGLAWHPDGRLIVADAFKGLLAMEADGTLEVLSTAAGGVPFGFTDDVDVAKDGRIYFTDASSRFDQSEYQLDLLEGRPYGRLLRYDPADGSTTVLLDGLYFANGVALSPAGDFVLVNETWRYRVRRLWLSGPRAGEDELFIDNLAGFPDGISTGSDGAFWVAMPSPRKANVDALSSRPWLKNLVAKLPEFAQPAATRYGLVVRLNAAGAIVGSYHDSSGEHVWEVTSVEEHGGYLHLGSLTTDRIARLPVPAVLHPPEAP